jgi:hypothetical protein
MARQRDASLCADVAGRTGDVTLAAFVRSVLAILNVVAKLEKKN